MDIDLEILNNHFAYYREESFSAEYYCDYNCNECVCDCCGSRIDCENDPRTCGILQEAKKKYEKLITENFIVKKIHGFDMATNSERIVAITDKIIDIQHYKVLWNKVFQEIKKSDLKLIPKIIPELYEIPDSKTQYKKRLIDSCLKLINAPYKIYFSPETPLIIKDKHYTILIAYRISHETEG